MDYNIIASSTGGGCTGGQVSKYVSDGATFIYANYGQNPASGLVNFLESYPSINMVGFTNEPNGCGTGQACQTPQQYAQMLISYDDAEKQGGATTPICAFEVAGDAGSGSNWNGGTFTGESPYNYVDQAVNQYGAAGHFKDACIHIYPTQSASSWSAELSILSTNLKNMEAVVKVPIYLTEACICAGGSAAYKYSTPFDQAMTQMIQMYEGLGFVKGIFWYDLVDGSNWSYHLFDTSYNPTSIAATYASIISSYQGTATTTTSSITTSISSTSNSSSTFSSTTGGSPTPRMNGSVFYQTLGLIQTDVRSNVTGVEEFLVAGLLAGAFIAIRRRD